MKIDFGKNEFSEHIRLTLLAVLVGLIAGLASVIFKKMIFFSQSQFWRAESFISSVSSQPWYLTILIPTLGGLIIGPIIYYGAREAKGHGVPEIMDSLIFRGGTYPSQSGRHKSPGIFHLYWLWRLCRARRPDRSDKLSRGIVNRPIVPDKRKRDEDFGCCWSSSRHRRNL